MELRRSERPDPKLWAVLAAWAAWTLWAAVRTAGNLSDDAFITLRYAENFARGQGLLFNPGERVFGCTEPLLALLLGAARWATGASLPILATAVHAIGLLALAALVLVGAARSGRALSGVVAGSLILALPFCWSLQGFAWVWVAVLLAAAALLAVRRPVLAGVLAGLAVGFRPDALLGVALLGLFVGATPLGGRKPFLRLIVGAALTVGLLVLCAWLWFGQVLPVTLAAKQAFANGTERAGTRSGLGFWPAAWPVFARVFGDWMAPVAVLWGVFGGVLGLARIRRVGDPVFALLVGFGAALAVAYPILGVSFWSWYVILPLIALLLGLAQSLAWGGRSWRWVLALPALLALIAAGISAARQWGTVDQAGPRAALYRRAGAWLAQSTPPTARVAAFEVGTLAFYADRPVDDLLGLVSPQYIAAVANGDWAGALLASRADFVVLTGESRINTQARWFTRRYRLADEITVGKERAAIYAYRRRERNRSQTP
ncbi:MAG TPA: hypothetical protein VGS22_19660 [Thermoanaerobaculia bacterium]|jgi:hypothetical protein|nr:hypothetical protein [Thermoanaerobaculia bacterium]